MKSYSPFIETATNTVEIRPDWVKQDEVYRVVKGTRKGRLFLYPGFRPCRFSRQKPAGTFRIFALGDSTTFGQWVGADNAYPKVIERRLQTIFPGRHVQVINLGCPGLESGRVAILVDTILNYDPDLILVYCGQNEMLMGETITPPKGIPYTVRAALLRYSTLAAWLNYYVSAYHRSKAYDVLSEEAAAANAGKILTYDLTYDQELSGERYRLLSPSYLQEVANTYAANIRHMILSARRRAVGIVFISPVANLMYPPELSAHRETFGQEARFTMLLNAASEAYQERKYEDALASVDQAIALSPDFAMAHYARGRLLLELGQREQALPEFQRAVDLNVHSHRINSVLQSTMIDVMVKEGADWVDLRPVFQKDLSVASSVTLFVDHCHPTKYGHQLIAEAVLPAITRVLQHPAPHPR